MQKIFFVLLFLVTVSFHSIGFSQVQDSQVISGFIVKTVSDDEGIKVVLKPSIVHSSALTNSKLKTVHISNQLKNYVMLLSQIQEAQQKSQFIKVIESKSQVEIKK